jgi:hypothetical protein
MGIYKNTVLAFSIQTGTQALARFHELKQYTDDDWIYPLRGDNCRGESSPTPQRM